VLSLLVGVAAVAGCSSSSSDQDADSGKVSLTYWAWAPNMDKVAALWNAKNPNIHVTVSKQASGEILLTKVLTAAKGGQPPDLIQAEYQALPTLVSNDVVADINDRVKSVKDDFDEGIWQQVSFAGHAYAVPQDAAPMMLYYRADLFKQFGLAVPTTWDQFAAEAKALHAKDPKRYLTTFSANDPGWFAGLAQQAGASWWKTSGDTWSVAVADAATSKVADYWGGLVNSGVISGAPMYTPAWNKALDNGTLLAWPSAVWGPGVLVGSAPSTKGKWAIAPLPQWSAGEQKTGSWGGSSTAIAAKSKHQAAAAKFATWLNTAPEAVKALVTQAAVYPACTTSAATAALASPPEFFANQPDFYRQAATIGHTAAGFTWGPDVNVTYATYTDAFGKAIQAKSSFSAAVQAMQTATVADMKKNGFKVS
jgi:multiple sugar transport system substrate-binding protein